MNIKKSFEFFTHEYEFKTLISSEEIDNLKNCLKCTQTNRTNVSKCQWIINKENKEAIVIKIIENNQALTLTVPIISFAFGPSGNNNDSNYYKITLCIKEVIEAIEDKYLKAKTERDQIIFIFRIEEGEIVIEQTQRCSKCIIKDISCLQMYLDETESNCESQSEEDWCFRVVDNELFTSLIKTIATAHEKYENFFILKGINKDTINLLFYFGEPNEDNPQYYCSSNFDINIIKQSKKINCGLGIRYRTKDISDFLLKYDNKKNGITYSINTKLVLTIEILKDKSTFQIQKDFLPIIIY